MSESREPDLPSSHRIPHLSVMPTVERETETLRRMTPAEKLAVMHGLIRQAWELKAAVIRARDPALPESEVRARAWELVGGDGP